MIQKKQKMMFSDAELGLIKSVFAEEGIEYIYLIRNVLLQFPLTKEEEAKLRKILTPELLAVVKKRVFPTISPDMPLFELADMFQPMTRDLMSRSVEDMAPHFDVKLIVIDYLEQRFGVLENPGSVVVNEIVLDSLKNLRDKDAHTRFVHTFARNYILSHVDAMLNHLNILAGSKNETVEETKKKLERDSAK